MKEIGRKLFRDQELDILSILESAQDSNINFVCSSQFVPISSESCRDVDFKGACEVNGTK